MRSSLLLAPILVLACKKQESDTAADVPTWDPEAAAVTCAYDQVLDGSLEAPLLDAVLEDADLDLEAVGYDEADWAKASYGGYLDDPFLLSWFYDYHWRPMRLPCLGAQVAADLDQAGANDHPVATALGEAMVLLDAEPVSEPIDPAAYTSQSVADLSGLPADLAQALAPVLVAMEAVAEARAAFEDDLPIELEYLVDYGHGGAILDYYADPDLTDEEVQSWVLSSEGPRGLYDPARVLAFAVEEADLSRFAGQEASLEVSSELGEIVVAGPDADEPGDIGAVALYLDLGGDDVYTHPAGASDDHVPVAVHIDLGGADRYGYEETDEGSEHLLPADAGGRYDGDSYYGTFSLSTTGRQGSGRLGVGLLFDLGGDDDHYQSLKVSQGWGHLGVGVLYDDGGDDTYLGEEGVQGAASMGIGLFMDGGGDDEHRTFAKSQGFGYIAAAGLAWDAGGDDTWYANPGKEADGGLTVYYSPQLPGDGNSSFCQGAGFGMRDDTNVTFLSGGLGALRDAGGSDVYTASTFAQGSGYWQGTGLLLDGEGDDTYDAYYYVQGGAAHYAAGALLDDGTGADRFNTRMTPNYMQIGAGHDFSVGVLVNEGGDDEYVYGGLAGGASNCEGVGLFADNDGTDTYHISSTYSTGLGNHSSECIDAFSRNQVDSIGLFLESGADSDTYEWPDEDRTAPDNDTTFGYDWSGDDHEKGGGVDGDGETALHAFGG